MEDKTLKGIIKRAAEDDDYLNELLNYPDNTLRGMDISQEEKNNLAAIFNRLDKSRKRSGTMEDKTLKGIIKRAAEDEAYLNSVLVSPDATLRGMDISQEEKKNLVAFFRSLDKSRMGSDTAEEKTLKEIIKKAADDDAYLKKLFYSPQETLNESGIDDEQKKSFNAFLKALADQRSAKEKVDKVFENTLAIFGDMRWMNIFTYVLGFCLIIFSVFLLCIGKDEIYIILFGGGGIATLIVQLLVGPMKMSPLSLSTFLQSHIIFDSYNHQVGIWYEFQRDNRDFGWPLELEEALTANDAYNTFRAQSVELLQKMSNLEKDGAQETPHKKE